MANFEVDTAVIMAGGVGSRDLPMSKLLPKETAEVYGLPVMARIAMQLAEVGVTNVITIVGEDYDDHKQNFQEVMHERWFGPSPRLEKYLRENGKEDKIPLLNQAYGLSYDYVRQPSEGGYGTGFATFLVADKLAELDSRHFMLLSGDELLHAKDGSSPLRIFVDSAKASGASHAMMVKPVPRQDSGEYAYGMVIVDENNNLMSLEEKPKAELVTGQPLANVSKYIFEATSVMAALGAYMKTAVVQKGVQPQAGERAQDEYYLTDILTSLDGGVHAHFTEAMFLDAGNKDFRLVASMILSGKFPPAMIKEAQKLLGLIK